MRIDRFAAMPLMAGIIMTVLLGWLFGEITEEVLESEELVSFDHWVIAHVGVLHSPGMTRAMIFITHLGGSYVVWPVTALISLVLWFKSRKAEAKFLVAAMSGGELLNQALKWAIRRARPEPPSELIQAWGWSYPSGHAFLSVLFYFSIAYLIFLYFRSRKAGWVFFSIAGILAVLIAFSRVYLMVHFPSDVLAGLTAGLLWFSLCVAVAEHYRRNEHPLRKTGKRP
jgi:undecaprenyl-diphosphatase